METVFLGSFLFGVLFTVITAVLGVASAGIDFGHDVGHGGHDVELPQHGPMLGHHGGNSTVHHGHSEGHPAPGQRGLPILNVSSLLAFLTWFGAAGYILLRFVGWPLIATVPVAVVAGLAGALLVARFLGAILAGERVMNPADYVLEGTLARVTVTIPAGGVGEIVFTKGEVRRSEAARGLEGAALARGTEVVILDYADGIATVQSYDELTRSEDTGALGEPRPPAGTER